MKDLEELLEEFHKAKREGQKLSLALLVLHSPCPQGAKAGQELLKYLNYRRRSAVMELIRIGDLTGLKAMGARNWLEKQYLWEYREEARKQNETEIWAWLYRREYSDSPPSLPGGFQPSLSLPAQSSDSSASGGRSRESLPTAAHRSRLCRQVWQLTVRKLRLRLPGLSEALSALHFAAREGIAFLAGEGFTVCCQEQELLQVYRRGPDQVSRSLMHLLLHNIYLHPLRWEGKDARTWNLACDLAVERLLDGGLLSKAIPERPGKDYRDFLLKDYHLDLPSWDAEGIYRLLLREHLREVVLEKLEGAYRVDDHSLWQGMQPWEPSRGTEVSGEPGSSQLEEGSPDKNHFLSFWSRIGREWSLQREGQHQKAGLTAGKDSQEVRLRKQEGYDYRRFLERFMVCQEEVELDLDSFDYLPYWYSRTHYPDIVLLEPLEYKEVHKLDEMVIAIDTSASCSGRVVRRFLEETYQILTARGNFFSKMQVHVIQCDAMIQEHVILHSREEFLDYMEKVTVKGLGGTDFRPVFALVDQMIENREIRDLKGLLYFTDGDGVYPTSPPAYETAFIFLNRAYEKHEVPAWGLRLNLGLRMEDI